MDMRKLTTFFMWCTVINGGLLVAAMTGCILGPDMSYTLQGVLFDVPRETIAVAIYFFLGVFKIMWLIFNVVPYITLLMMQREGASHAALSSKPS